MRHTHYRIRYNKHKHMKKRAFFITILSILMLVSNHSKATAAACTISGQHGIVSLAISKLPSRGTYTIWTRMQAPDDSHNRYRLEVNGENCYEVGGSSITPNTWVWVAFQDGNLSSKVQEDFDKTDGNKVRLIGSDAGVKVDRLLLVKTDCIPEGLGSNCQSSGVPLRATEVAGANELPPISTGSVSGTIVPSATLSHDPSVISKVVYFSDGSAIPTAAGNGLDTTLLENGMHRISLQITKTDGTVINEATTLYTDNAQNAFSPLRRMYRLHARSVIAVSTIAGVGLLAVAGFLIIRHVRLQKRLLNFHGF
ncbi:hypothetical protein BH10PAT3_BH10PAT3_6020 [soil metagenome]